MIPLLIYTLFKKYIDKPQLKSLFLESRHLWLFLVAIFSGLIILLFSLIPIISGAQDLRLNYTIKKGGNNIGWLTIEKSVEGKQSVMTLNSEIKTRAIFLVTVFAKETATFESGKLIRSTQFRKTNGTTKLDKQTRLIGEKYEVFENGKKEHLVIPFIGANLLSLYFHEPLGFSSVYCDKLQSFVPIIKSGDAGYKVMFPGGSSNRFYYNGGTCTKIEIDAPFYSVTILLNAKT